MKPSSGWFPPVDSIQKITVVKFFDRRKNPQDFQGLTLYLGQMMTHSLGHCCITNIVQHSVFVEFTRMPSSVNVWRRKECKGYESGNPPAWVFLLRVERYSSVICLIRKRCLLARRARVRPLRPFPTARPVMCAIILACMFAMMCVAHQPLGFWRHHHFCVFCVDDLPTESAL